MNSESHYGLTSESQNVSTYINNHQYILTKRQSKANFATGLAATSGLGAANDKFSYWLLATMFSFIVFEFLNKCASEPVNY